MNSKLVYGVGINDAGYHTQRFEKTFSGKKKVFECQVYRKWRSMLQRCYDPKMQEKQPTYKGCTVCEEWLTFSKFKEWCDNQYKEDSWHLDKDILVPNNKIYSPETCRFVPPHVNTLLLTTKKARGMYLIGVSLNESKLNPYRADCHNPISGGKYSKSCSTELEAHNLWRKWKSEVIIKVIEVYKDNLNEDIILRFNHISNLLLDFDLPVSEIY